MPQISLPAILAISPTVSLLSVLFALVSLMMMLIILVQKPKGGGLSGAFGGAGGNEGAFVGAKVGDFLTIVTASFFVLFVLLAMGLTWTTTPEANADDVPVIPVAVNGAPAAAAAANPAAGDDGATPISPTVGDDPDSATANNAHREPVAADMTAHDLVDDVLDVVAGDDDAAPAAD